MDVTPVVAIVLSFAVGLLSSIAATWLLLLRKRARFRLRFQSIVKLIEGLSEEIRTDGYQFDHIVALGRNSGVVGSIMAGITGLGAVISVTMVKSRLPDGERTISLDEAADRVLPVLAGKRILVLLCCNDSGASLAYFVERLENMDPPPASIRTAALYSTPSPAFMPTYTSVIVGVHTKKTMTQILEGLPWVSAHWVHPFGKERRPEAD